MKKIGLFIMFCVLAMMSAQAQTQELNIYRGTNLSQIDGKEDDAVWSKVPKAPITRPFNDEQATVDAFFKMFYTDDYLYVYIDVTDDVHNPVWAGKADNEKVQDVQHLYDKVELYFDINDILKDGKSPAYINGHMDPGHYQLAPYFEEDGYDSPYLLSGLLYGAMSDQAMVCYTLKDDYTSYSMEYEIPLNSFVNDKGESMSKEKFIALPNGMGFDVTVVDNDADGKGRKRVVWCSDKQEAYYNMDNCGVVHFIDKSVDDFVTGVSNIRYNGEHSDKIYTLEGVEMKQGEKLHSGIYIKDGKKIIIR